MIRGTLLLVVVGTARVWIAGPVPDVRVNPVVDEVEGLLAESARALSEREERKRRFATGETLDPNRASEIQLDRLPGVGPALARSIVEFREGYGPFARASDLLAVKGLGPVSLTRISPLLDFSVAPPRIRRSRGATVSTGGRVGPTSKRPSTKLSLNSASAGDLESIPGIGPVTAQRILEVRSIRGRFATLDDLLEVPGIGPKTLERLRAYLRVRR